MKSPHTDLQIPERRATQQIIQDDTSSEFGLIPQETKPPLGNSSVTHLFSWAGHSSSE